MTKIPDPIETINALTLVVTTKHMRRPVDDGVGVERLQGTFRDVNEVDRVVYVDHLGTEMYLKDRYPEALFPGVEIKEHRIDRPVNMTLENAEQWRTTLRELRIKLLQTGSL